MRFANPHPIFIWTSLVVVLLVQRVVANTEKVIFTVHHDSTQHSSGSDKDLGASHGPVDPSQWKRMFSPHTIIRAETLVPSYYEKDVTIAALRKHAKAAEATPSPHHQSRPLIKEIESGQVDLQNREFKWYVLEDLEDGASFELRISYPATSPADFDMVVWTLDEAQAHVPKDLVLKEHFSQNTMLARIKATYTGVSYRSDGVTGPETRPVPYNIVLERLYFMIPYQALKLAAVLVVVVVVGLGYLVPTTHRILSSHAIDRKKTE
ncbi:hypothetical protein BGX31_010839 [Mortierella sp. GBA43]|nr:hypothetical protein BGX31_010839 [Mortierella sp. GBA43]